MSFLHFAQTPPMGWNSWDCYGASVTEAEVIAHADFMAEHCILSGNQGCNPDLNSLWHGKYVDGRVCGCRCDTDRHSEFHARFKDTVV